MKDGIGSTTRIKRLCQVSGCSFVQHLGTIGANEAQVPCACRCLSGEHMGPLVVIGPKRYTNRRVVDDREVGDAEGLERAGSAQTAGGWTTTRLQGLSTETSTLSRHLRSCWGGTLSAFEHASLSPTEAVSPTCCLGYTF